MGLVVDLLAAGGAPAVEDGGVAAGAAEEDGTAVDCGGEEDVGIGGGAGDAVAGPHIGAGDGDSEAHGGAGVFPGEIVDGDIVGSDGVGGVEGNHIAGSLVSGLAGAILLTRGQAEIEVSDFVIGFDSAHLDVVAARGSGQIGIGGAVADFYIAEMFAVVLADVVGWADGVSAEELLEIVVVADEEVVIVAGGAAFGVVAHGLPRNGIGEAGGCADSTLNLAQGARGAA